MELKEKVFNEKEVKQFKQDYDEATKEILKEKKCDCENCNCSEK